MRYGYFIACAPGFEPLLGEELEALGLSPELEAGGANVEGDIAIEYRLNVGLGLGLKVLRRVATFEARHFSSLEKAAKRVPFERWLHGDTPIRLRVRATRSKLYHSGGIAQRVRGAIAHRLGVDGLNEILPKKETETGEGKGRQKDDQRDDLDPSRPGAVDVHIRLHDDQCTISLDTSGVLLHRRGYRQATAKAPLREDLARGLLRLAGWPIQPLGTTRLVDPMCGSGTIPIEAWLLATKRPPGADRRFAFEHLRDFDEATFARERSALIERAELVPLDIWGSDRNEGAIAAALSNAARAGAEGLHFDVAGATAAPGLSTPHEGACLVVTNPPYGRRVGKNVKSLRPLFQSLGRCVEARATSFTFIIDDQGLARATGLDLESLVMTDHGGSKVRILQWPRKTAGDATAQ